jgi:hypothetical protein
MPTFRRCLLGWVLVWLLCPLTQAHAQGVELMAQFMKQVNSGRASFTQVVTSPAKAASRRARKHPVVLWSFTVPASSGLCTKNPLPKRCWPMVKIFGCTMSS